VFEWKEEQKRDELCKNYESHDKFYLDKDYILYQDLDGGKFRIVIPRSLVSTVLKYYHDLAFTAHQGEARTIDLVKLKY
jgi:hypothetical protein